MDSGKSKGSIASRYSVIRPLGKGTGGAVLLARDTYGADDSLVAIKILEPGAAEGVEGQMIMREFEILSRVHHPHLVEVLDFGQLDNQGLFLVEEFVEGFSLQDAHFNHRDEIQAIILAILSALAYLHDVGVVHRDIKPANIMVQALDDPMALPHAMLVDFGLSSNNPSNDRLWGGTAFFMAPEIRRREPATPRADLYSLGVSLFYLLCGVQPVPDNESVEEYTVIPPHVLNTKISLPLSRFVLILLRQVKNVDLKNGAEAYRLFYHDVASSQYRDLLNAGVDPLFSSRVYAAYQNRFLREIVARSGATVMEEQLTPFNHMITVVDQDPQVRREVSQFVQNKYKHEKRRVVLLNPTTSQIHVTWQVAVMEILTTLATAYNDDRARVYRANFQIFKLYDLFYGPHIYTRLGMLPGASGDGEHFNDDVYLNWFNFVVHQLPSKPERVNNTYLFINDIDSLIVEKTRTLKRLYELLESLPSQTILATAKTPLDYMNDDARGLKALPAVSFTSEDIKHFLIGVADPDTVFPNNIDQAFAYADGDIRYVQNLPFELQLYGYALVSKDASQLPSRRPYKSADSLSQLLRRRIIDLSEVERKILEVASIIKTDVDWVVIRAILDDGEFEEEVLEKALLTLETRLLLKTYIKHSVRLVKRPDEELRKVVMARLSPSRLRINQLRINKEFTKFEAEGRISFRQIVAQFDDQTDARTLSDAWYQTAISERNASDLDPTPLFEASLAMIRSVQSMEREITKFSLEEVALRRAALAKEWMTFGQPRFALQAIEIAWKTALQTKSPWVKYRIALLGLQITLDCGHTSAFDKWEVRISHELPSFSSSVEISLIKFKYNLGIGEFGTAFSILKNALQRAQHYNDGRLETEVISLFGFFREELGENAAALDYYKKAIRMAKDRDCAPQALMAYIGYGRLQGRFGTTDQALPALALGFKQAIVRGRVDAVAEAFYAIASAYARINHYENSYRFYTHFDFLVKKVNDVELRDKAEFLKIRLEEQASPSGEALETLYPRIFELGRKGLLSSSETGWGLPFRRDVLNVALLSAQILGDQDLVTLYEDGLQHLEVVSLRGKHVSQQDSQSAVPYY